MKPFFLSIWTVACTLGGYAVYITDSISRSQQLWSYAGLLVVWAFIVCAVLDEVER